MIDDLSELIVAAATDLSVEKAAKRHRWVRILRALVGLLFAALLCALLYITFKYA